WLEFLHLVRDRVQRAVEHPELRERFEHSDRHYTRRRFSRFTDKETANGACTMVLRAHEPAVRRWVADRGGWWRQHYTADLGRPVGTFADHESGFAGEVTGAAVVMRIDNESGQPFIFDAWPEHPLDPAPREAFPDLVHVFGGYFSGVPGPPFVAQQNLHVSLADPARSRVRRQLDALLELDDDALRRALVALGSHVLPVAHRRWVELMRWRLDAYPWRRASGLE
ncbi:MAG: RNase A-like domain-containing protein, partial [Actinomycetes bacterium]